MAAWSSELDGGVAVRPGQFGDSKLQSLSLVTNKAGCACCCLLYLLLIPYLTLFLYIRGCDLTSSPCILQEVINTHEQLLRDARMRAVEHTTSWTTAGIDARIAHVLM